MIVLVTETAISAVEVMVVAVPSIVVVTMVSWFGAASVAGTTE